MFIIWKSNRPITNAEIAQEHSRYFGPPSKDESTVRGIVNRIKARSTALGRSYVRSSGQRQAHQVEKDECVHSQTSAILLLELKTGFLRFGKPEMEILLSLFETYLIKKYKGLFKGQTDVRTRLRNADKSGYARFVKYGKVRGIETANRLDDDLAYILLIVEDYLRQLRSQPDAKKLVIDLRNLLSLFGRKPRRAV